MDSKALPRQGSDARLRLAVGGPLGVLARRLAWIPPGYATLVWVWSVAATVAGCSLAEARRQASSAGVREKEDDEDDDRNLSSGGNRGATPAGNDAAPAGSEEAPAGSEDVEDGEAIALEDVVDERGVRRGLAKAVAVAKRAREATKGLHRHAAPWVRCAGQVAERRRHVSRWSERCQALSSQPYAPTRRSLGLMKSPSATGHPRKYRRQAPDTNLPFFGRSP